MIAVDTNIIAYLLIEGPYTNTSQKILEKDNDWVVPLVWRPEFRNVLVSSILFSKMSIDRALDTYKNAVEILNNSEHEVLPEDILKLSAESKCSAYDCEFIALAKHFNVPLITEDKELIKAFPNIAISGKNFIKM